VHGGEVRPRRRRRGARGQRRRIVIAGFGVTAVAALAFLAGGEPKPPSSPREPALGDGARGTVSSGSTMLGGGVDVVQRARLARALERGVHRAAGLDGSVEAGVMLSPWRDPLVVTSEPGGEQRLVRAWSLSKVFTAVTLLRKLGWGHRPGTPPTPEVEAALAGALTRSENCRQRRLVLELQRLAGGTPQAARTALAETLSHAGAHVRIAAEAAPPEPVCVGFLQTQGGLENPLASGLLLGTSTWRIGDAVRFVHALDTGRYGKAVSKRVLSLMREPKAISRETPEGDFTADRNWGAGRALADFAPAYKAGWGGALQRRFIAGQLASVELPGGGMAAVGVMFHPHSQPPKDDPGLTKAPSAVETVMSALADEFRR